MLYKGKRKENYLDTGILLNPNTQYLALKRREQLLVKCERALGTSSPSPELWDSPAVPQVHSTHCTAATYTMPQEALSTQQNSLARKGKKKKYCIKIPLRIWLRGKIAIVDPLLTTVS